MQAVLPQPAISCSVRKQGGVAVYGAMVEASYGGRCVVTARQR